MIYIFLFFFLAHMILHPSKILEYFSTTPTCEPEYFLPTVISDFKYILENKNKKIEQVQFLDYCSVMKSRDETKS